MHQHVDFAFILTNSPPYPLEMAHCAQWAVRGGIGKKIDFQKRSPNIIFAYILNRK